MSNANPQELEERTYTVEHYDGAGYGFRAGEVTGLDIDDAGTTLRDRINDKRNHNEVGDNVELECGCVYGWSHHVDTKDGVHIVELLPMSWCDRDSVTVEGIDDWENYRSEFGEYWIIREVE